MRFLLGLTSRRFAVYVLLRHNNQFFSVHINHGNRLPMHDVRIAPVKFVNCLLPELPFMHLQKVRRLCDFVHGRDGGKKLHQHQTDRNGNRRRK